MRSQRGSTVVVVSAVAFAGCAPEQPEAGDQGALSAAQGQTFTAFESGQVRPLAISADRRLVYATNTPDNRVEIAFKKFNPAFPALLGRSAPLGDAQMQAFTDFILQVSYPPNPIRNLTTR